MYLAERMAEFARSIDIRALPSSVVEATVRIVADTLACGVAALEEPGPMLLRQYARERAGRPEATLLGSGERVDLPLATLVNATLVRDLDANDIYAAPPGKDTGHFSDAIPALLAAAELAGASGQDLLAAVVAVYELQAALAEAYHWMQRGLHSVSQVAWAVPAAAGWLLGLSREQTVSAIGLAGTTGGLVLQSWLKPGPELPLIKGAAPGLVCQRALEAVQLAARGLTAPPDALEALFERLPADVDPAAFDRLDGRGDWAVLRTIVKRYPAQFYTQAAIAAASSLHREIGSVDDIAVVTVYGHRQVTAGVQGSPSAYAPRTRAAADHSTPFVVAIALRDGDLTPASYQGEPWHDPALLDLMRRIDLVIDPEFERAFHEEGVLGCRVVVELIDGRRLETTVRQPPGHPDSPLAREELLAKLRALVEPRLGPGAADRLLSTAERLPEAPDVAVLLHACRVV
ncbi:MmgE/PrpD family protein [Thermomicrobiaceae bacterium CFH 74404]|uniref:MmgE/PrpD family protein n=1 Tax=Thermalbibacter longus TaxID=2951981 RepID=A0AA41WB09_9BACT|nr:MmgE/PrpD family protein [Thermalbibacter longus]MCM8749291.1 MmgE/PrpD family protein [Thermalbibacter longus]